MIEKWQIQRDFVEELRVAVTDLEEAYQAHHDELINALERIVSDLIQERHQRKSKCGNQ